MSIRRLSEGVLGASTTLGLINFINDRGGIVEPELLIENIAVLFQASRTKIKNTISLLADVGIFKVSDGRISSLEVIAELEPLGTRLVDYVIENHLPPGFGNAMLLSESGNDVWVDAKRAPGKQLGIATLLVELGVFRRDRLTSPNWHIGKQYRDKFIQAVARQNETFSLGTLSAIGLQRKMKHNLEAGLRAEDWVVDFEKSRLESHPFKDQIRRISDEHVDAGFDILSFRDRKSLTHNRLIEVKSFVGAPSFYWSANEIERARQEGERYILYLVDRGKMQVEGYKPREIRGPFEFFFGSETPRDWEVVANEFRIFSNA